MTSIKEAIFSQLSTEDHVTAFVDDRIYPAGTAPSEPRYPIITYQKISVVHARHLKGGSGVAHSRIQINCWAKSDEEADNLADAVREMDNFIGTMGVGDSTLEILGTELADDSDEPIPPTDKSGSGKFGVRMDFIFSHRESLTPAA